MFLQELQKSEKKAFLELAFLIANKNGNITPKDRLTFENYRRELGLAKTDYKIEGKNVSDLNSTLKRFPKKTQKVFLLELISLALNSNDKLMAEDEVFKELLEVWNLEKYDFNKMKRWVDAFNDLLVEGYILLEDK